jgi:Protein of unknown function (DUF3752)
MKDDDRKRHRKDREGDPDDDDDDDRGDDHSVSSTSSSVSSREDRQHRKKNKKHKKHDKKRKKEKKRKKHKKEKKRKRRDNEEITDSSESENDRLDRKKDRKRRRKDSKKPRRDKEEEKSAKSTTPSSPVVLVLHTLLKTKPDFASDLPIILIRLAGGTTFDLRQVTDPSIATGLKRLFLALEMYGVKRDDIGMWMFQPPPGSGRRDELVLLRVIRSLLNDAGLTMDEIARYEQHPPPFPKTREEPDTNMSSNNDVPAAQTSLEAAEQQIKRQTFQLLSKFQTQDSELGPQLIGLCKMIAEGESVSLDELPDEKLKSALVSLFDACGLEKSEMEGNEDTDEEKEEDEDDNNGPLMGYGLSENADDNVQVKLATIMAACREGPPKRRAAGPMRRPTTEQEEKEANALYASNHTSNDGEKEEEDDGPLLPGEARKVRGPTLPPEVIRAQAEFRELQLKATAAGVDMPTQGGREEWMVVPGKYDFLSNIKSGQPMKSRGFQNKKSRDDEKEAAPIHPAVQAEMDAIMQAHQDARGPSLMDQHRAMKQKEKDATSTGGKKDWKWNRDDDLDAGRRVDKDALGMILGGAADNLKTKFQGGLNR